MTADPDRISYHPSLNLTKGLSVVIRILSDWLEVKLGGSQGSEASKGQLNGTLQTLCVTNTLQGLSV